MMVAIYNKRIDIEYIVHVSNKQKIILILESTVNADTN